MNLKYGQMWSRWDEADLFLVTGSSTLRYNRLIMGTGSAKEAADKWGDLPGVLGKAVSKQKIFREDEKNGLKIFRPYYLIVSDKWPKAKFGLFQTKDDYRKSSDPFLISTSCLELNKWIDHARVKLNRDPLVVMPCPGVGRGGLETTDVEPYLKTLPSCVEIWQYEHKKPLELDQHRAAKLLEGDRQQFLINLCDLLGKPLAELQSLCEKHGFRISSASDQDRLMIYFVFQSFFESNDMSNSWHAARNKLRQLA